MQTVLARYFETLKDTLKAYVELIENRGNPMTLFNSRYFSELYIIQFRYIQDTFRSLVESLSEAVN